jgi:D-lactate dehydrogenase
MLTLLQPDTERITPVEHKPTHDRAPEDLALGTPLWLRDDLIEILGKEQVHSRVIDLVKYATDASPYRMFPKVVVTPRTVEEVAKIFAYGQEKKLPVTIRSAGSSLSGQSQGDGILIDARKHWAGATVEDGGKRLRVRPGTVMFRANLTLHPYGYRLGPDPASSGVATVGGVIANNASGMCCGTVENSYKTLESVSFLLPSGTHINTADPDAENQFNLAEPDFGCRTDGD